MTLSSQTGGFDEFQCESIQSETEIFLVQEVHAHEYRVSDGDSLRACGSVSLLRHRVGRNAVSRSRNDERNKGLSLQSEEPIKASLSGQH